MNITNLVATCYNSIHKLPVKVCLILQESNALMRFSSPPCTKSSSAAYVFPFTLFLVTPGEFQPCIQKNPCIQNQPPVICYFVLAQYQHRLLIQIILTQLITSLKLMNGSRLHRNRISYIQTLLHHCTLYVEKLRTSPQLNLTL